MLPCANFLRFVDIVNPVLRLIVLGFLNEKDTRKGQSHTTYLGMNAIFIFNLCAQ